MSLLLSPSQVLGPRRQTLPPRVYGRITLRMHTTFLSVQTPSTWATGGDRTFLGRALTYGTRLTSLAARLP